LNPTTLNEADVVETTVRDNTESGCHT